MLFVSCRETAWMCLQQETEGDTAVMVLMLGFKTKVTLNFTSTDHVEPLTVTHKMMLDPVIRMWLIPAIHDAGLSQRTTMSTAQHAQIKALAT